MKKVLPLLLSFLVITTLTASAQYYNFQNYTVEDGLPQSQVFALHQDSRSNLWVGTHGGGLARFNGKIFEVFRRKDGLLSDVILEIMDDASGNLIIKTNLGFSVFDGKKFHNHPFTEGNLLNSDRMVMDKSGDIWLRVLQEKDTAFIYRFDGEGYSNMSAQFPELQKHHNRNALTVDSEGNIIISTIDKVYTFDGDELQLHPVNSYEEVQDKMFGIVYTTVDDKMLFTVQKDKEGEGYFFDKEEGLTKLEIPEEMGNSFTFFYEDRSGSFWLVNPHDHVLYRWNRISDGNKVEHFTADSGLPVDGIRSMTQDMEGNIWIGTDGSGLFKYGGAKFVSFLSSMGLEDYFIWSIYKDSKGNYWFGSANNGLLKYDGKQLQVYTEEEGNHLGIITSILEHDGKLLIGSRGGLKILDGSSFINVNADFGLPEYASVNDILKTDKGFWIATLNNGVYFYDGEEMMNYNAATTDLGSNSIDDIFMDRSGVVWFATRGGLSRLKDGIIKNFVNNQYGLFPILQITDDASGNIWAATYGSGICKVSIDEHDQLYVEKIDTETGLSSDNVYSILKDEEGNIWAGCQRGVDKLSLDREGNVSSIRNYDNFEGFSGFENNSKANFIDDEGKLWFGTINGVMVYNPEMDIVNNHAPVVNITDLKLFYKDVNWTAEEYEDKYEQLTSWTGLPEQLILPHNSNHVTFEFEGLSYTVPEKVQFQWKLEGVDTDWSPVTDRTDAVYSNLAPGEYVFLVRAANNDGIWTEEAARYSFAIQPPFWETWWFRLLIVLFVVTVVVIISWLRNKFIREKRKELEELVAFKTKKLEVQKNEILDKNNELQQQYKNLELLSKIGRDITANITIESLLESVYKKLNSLMDASIMGFGIFRKEEGVIEFPRIITTERNVETIKIPLDDKYCLAVNCLKENREIIIRNFEEEFSNRPEFWNPPLKGKESVSIVFIPLIYNGQPMGVITVQSPQSDAYNDYHLNILRNIANYVKVALANANAYEKIQEQKNELSKANKDIVRQKGEIEANNQKLIELNNEKSNIIGIVAHDLKNPLTSAFTMANILKNESNNLEEEQVQCIHVIEKSINRMNDMINRLLDIRKIEDKITALKLEKVNLEKIIRDVNSNLLNEITRKSIDMSVEGEELYARVDPDYAIQVFENLISNAIKFSPPHKAVKVVLAKDNGKARAEIIDEGPGLTEEDKKRVFGKFQRLSAKPTGGEQSTGLGLSIVKKYVEAMNGKVWCESEKGKGANFIVEFQRVD